MLHSENLQSQKDRGREKSGTLLESEGLDLGGHLGTFSHLTFLSVGVLTCKTCAKRVPGTSQLIHSTIAALKQVAGKVTCKP